MSDEHIHTPAAVLAAALIDGGVGMRPSAVQAAALVWPVYVGHLPDTPDNAIAVYDTTGRAEGRIQRTGQTVRKPGWQVRVRATNYVTGAAKIIYIQTYLDSIRMLSIAIGEAGYKIVAVTQTSGLLPLGQEPDANKREGFTLNGTITFEEL